MCVCVYLQLHVCVCIVSLFLSYFTFVHTYVYFFMIIHVYNDDVQCTSYIYIVYVACVQYEMYRYVNKNICDVFTNWQTLTLLAKTVETTNQLAF